jgi:hypothetical protein
VMTLDDHNDNDDDIIMHTMIVINMIAMRWLWLYWYVVLWAERSCADSHLHGKKDSRQSYDWLELYLEEDE